MGMVVAILAALAFGLLMAVYSLNCIFEPQFISNAATALTFSAGAGGGTTVPASFAFQIQSCRVSNTSAAPVSLKVWRVPSGGGVGNSTLIVPSINIPVATNTAPQFDLTALWGVVLQTGDSIVMQAGAANDLVVQADGVIISV